MDDVAATTTWLETERSNLTAVLEHAALLPERRRSCEAVRGTDP
jgi:hypothetical protein